MVTKTASTKKLMRFTDDGNERALLNSETCSSLVTIDHIKRKLYWIAIEDCGGSLEEAELDGSSPETMVTLSGVSAGSLDQYEDKYYYTQGGTVVRNGLNSNFSLLYNGGSSTTLGGLVVVHPSKQPPGEGNILLAS